MASPSKKLLFIANPISGGKGKIPLEELLPKNLNRDLFEWSIYHTQCRGDATERAKDACGKVDAVVAVGGDGTINEVAQGLVHSDTPMGIVPNGSGNGFANYFNIPLKPEKAIERINEFKTKLIDTGTFNEQLFLSVAGLGFDAEVAHAFDQSPTRGFYTYVWLTLKTYFRYKSHHYSVEINGKELDQKAFLITAANSSQFGNDAFIAPDALIDDGLLDLVLLKPFNPWHITKISSQLFKKQLNYSPYYHCIKSKHIKIKSACTTAQIDGEPIQAEPTNEIKIQPASLKMLV